MVYVPTSPNPTSGYIEIVPMKEVVQTDWSIEEAMSFVMTGGTNSPDSIRFFKEDGGDGKIIGSHYGISQEAIPGSGGVRNFIR